MDFLTTGQYVELVEWSKEILNVFNPQLPEEQKSLLESIRHRDLNQVIEYFKKLNYTLIQNDTYNVILNQLEKNKATILTQWQFLEIGRASCRERV